MSTSKDLVLLTHSYPFRSGDSPFVDAEIRALASQFETVYVWTLEPRDSDMIEDIPRNVLYVGSLLDGGWGKRLLGLLSFQAMLRYLCLLLDEVRTRRAGVRLPRLLRAALTAVVGGSLLSSWLDLRDATRNDVVVYSFWGTDCGLSIVGLRVAPTLTAIRMHGYDLYEERVGYLPFRGQLLRSADLILTVSEHGASYLRAKYGRSGVLPRVIVSRLGTVDCGLGPGAPKDLVRVVSCSSLIPVKRVSLILETVRCLALKVPVEWVHFGDGPGAGELRALMTDLPPGLMVDLRGEVPHSEVLRYYQETPVSVFLNLSNYEGLPVSVMEALSFGVPVVATDVGGTSEIVGELFHSGIIVSRDTKPRMIADAVERVVGEPDRWAPRSVWAELCDYQSNAKRTADLLADSRFDGSVDG